MQRVIDWLEDPKGSSILWGSSILKGVIIVLSMYGLSRLYLYFSFHLLKLLEIIPISPTAADRKMIIFGAVALVAITAIGILAFPTRRRHMVDSMTYPVLMLVGILFSWYRSTIGYVRFPGMEEFGIIFSTITLATMCYGMWKIWEERKLTTFFIWAPIILVSYSLDSGSFILEPIFEIIEQRQEAELFSGKNAMRQNDARYDMINFYLSRAMDTTLTEQQRLHAQRRLDDLEAKLSANDSTITAYGKKLHEITSVDETLIAINETAQSQRVTATLWFLIGLISNAITGGAFVKSRDAHKKSIAEGERIIHTAVEENQAQGGALPSGQVEDDHQGPRTSHTLYEKDHEYGEEGYTYYDFEFEGAAMIVAQDEGGKWYESVNRGEAGFRHIPITDDDLLKILRNSAKVPHENDGIDSEHNDAEAEDGQSNPDQSNGLEHITTNQHGDFFQDTHSGLIVLRDTDGTWYRIEKTNKGIKRYNLAPGNAEKLEKRFQSSNKAA